MEKALSSLCFPIWLGDEEFLSQTQMKKGDASARASLEEDTILDEARDVLDPTQRATDESEPEYDDILSKVVKKRNDLMEKNVFAGKEIQRLKLENENLRNLYGISKNATTALKEKIGSLAEEVKVLNSKVSTLDAKAVDDKKKVEKLEAKVHRMKLEVAAERSLCNQTLKQKDEQILALENTITTLRSQTIHAQNALDGGLFWS